MIKWSIKPTTNCIVYLCFKDETTEQVQLHFKGDLLETSIEVKEQQRKFFIGLGKRQELKRKDIKEVFAKIVKELRNKIWLASSIEIDQFIDQYGISIVKEIIEGLLLGQYKGVSFKTKQTEEEYSYELVSCSKEYLQEAKKLAEETSVISKAILFARDMVNMPGNYLRPLDFANQIQLLLKETNVEVQLLEQAQLEELGMKALLAVGRSSAYPPCMIVLRYYNNPESKEVTAFVGKGVTCDTGGYCLKQSKSMMGIKGDMAGGAAVTGAIYALAKNKKKANVIGVIPMCENRLSNGSLVPGDVIGSFGGKTIEICNTDAEGRLLLADAVAYAVQKEKATRVLDIATLTGAVVNLLGFTITGAICDTDEYWNKFEEASKEANELTLRIPFLKEHKNMIQSKIADLKNMGESYCGTITAGLFIREFANQVPWIHLDIAGTAWVEKPFYEYQSIGATGAGVSSLYYFAQKF